MACGESLLLASSVQSRRSKEQRRGRRSADDRRCWPQTPLKNLSLGYIYINSPEEDLKKLGVPALQPESGVEVRSP